MANTFKAGKDRQLEQTSATTRSESRDGYLNLSLRNFSNISPALQLTIKRFQPIQKASVAD
ncbi:MAG: hypothetical protein P0120_02095 [Nitrospira sp.]|nr:hypothetical protein [Nitrospira sp.]